MDGKQLQGNNNLNNPRQCIQKYEKTMKTKKNEKSCKNLIKLILT